MSAGYSNESPNVELQELLEGAAPPSDQRADWSAALGAASKACWAATTRSISISTRNC